MHFSTKYTDILFYLTLMPICVSACQMNEPKILECRVFNRKSMTCTFEAPLPNDIMKWTLVYSRCYGCNDLYTLFLCPNPTPNSCTWTADRKDNDKYKHGNEYTFFLFDQQEKNYSRETKFVFDTNLMSSRNKELKTRELDYRPCILGHEIISDGYDHEKIILSWIVNNNKNANDLKNQSIQLFYSFDGNLWKLNETVSLGPDVREREFILEYNYYYKFELSSSENSSTFYYTRSKQKAGKSSPREIIGLLSENRNMINLVWSNETSYAFYKIIIKDTLGNLLYVEDTNISSKSFNLKYFQNATFHISTRNEGRIDGRMYAGPFLKFNCFYDLEKGIELLENFKSKKTAQSEFQTGSMDHHSQQSSTCKGFNLNPYIEKYCRLDERHCNYIEMEVDPLPEIRMVIDDPIKKIEKEDIFPTTVENTSIFNPKIFGITVGFFILLALILLIINEKRRTKKLIEIKVPIGPPKQLGIYADITSQGDYLSTYSLYEKPDYRFDLTKSQEKLEEEPEELNTYPDHSTTTNDKKDSTETKATRLSCSSTNSNESGLGGSIKNHSGGSGHKEMSGNSFDSMAWSNPGYRMPEPYIRHYTLDENSNLVVNPSKNIRLNDIYDEDNYFIKDNENNFHNAAEFNRKNAETLLPNVDMGDSETIAFNAVHGLYDTLH